MSYWIKSRFVREEVLRLALIVAGFSWAVFASAVALKQKNEVLLVGISETGTTLISNDNRDARQAELALFVRRFLDTYYQFNETNHAEQVSRAGDLMSVELWESKREELRTVGEKLKGHPLSQSVSVQSIDRIDEERVEARLELLIQQRLAASKATLRVTLRVRERKRTAENPWPFEIVEMSDATL